MRTYLLAFFLVTVAFTGCLGDDDATDGNLTPGNGTNDTVATWHDDAIPLGENHSHTDREQHKNLSTPNFHVRGYNPLETDYHGGTSGDYLCGDVGAEGEQAIAVTHSFGTDVAFVITDVTDPENPEKIGEFILPYSHTYDVAVTPDADYVAVAISEATPDTGPDDQNLPLPPTPEQPVASFRSCGGQTQAVGHEQVPYKNGVLLVDITNPESPSVADWLPQPAIGPHSIFATTVDGTDHILASTTNLGHTASYFTFLEIQETPVTAKLVQTYQHSAQYPGASFQGTQPALVNGHVDGWIAEHPVTNTTIAYLANWNGGMHVLEQDPTTGTWSLIGAWNDYNSDAGAGMTGAIHGTLPISTTWNDKHYTFIGQEVTSRPADRPTGQVIMLDTTDPANPSAEARWTLPTDTEFDDSLQFSTHYFTLVNRTLFVSLYHGGVWAVDTHPIDGTHQLPSLGVFVPDETPPNPALEYADFQWTPIILDVLSLPNGDLVVFDGTSGLYTVSFDTGHPLPIPEPWTEDAWVGNQSTSPQTPPPPSIPR